MTRCPNCGSSVRAGAKFCTTCGFRLPVESNPTPEATTSRSPFDLTSTSTVAARWPRPDEGPVASAGSPGAADRSGAETAAGQDDATDSESDSGLAAASDPRAQDSEAEDNEAPAVASFGGWPAFGESNAQHSGWGPGSANGDQQPEEWPPSSSEEPEGADVRAEEQPAAWSSDPPMEASQDASDEPAAEIEADAELGDGAETDDLSAYSWLQSIEQSGADEPETESAPEGASEEAPSESAERDRLPSADDTDGDTGPHALTAAAPETAPGQGPAHERAMQLLDELRSLVPTLGGSGSGTSDLPGTVASSLEALLEESAAESERFQALRAAVATAQARPRDVDIMLDLVARADTIAAVLTAHDRYVAGIKDAAATLRGKANDEPAPRW